MVTKCLFNIRSWNAHIEHFLTDKVYTTCSLLCFTETRINNGQCTTIEQYVKGWKDIHKPTNNGLAICYDASKVNIIREFQPTNNVLQMLPVLIEIENEYVLLVLLYRKPGPIGTFIEDLIEQLSELPTEHRTIILGDFNLDLMLRENVDKFAPLVTRFHLYQRSDYTTHINGGILDLVFDNTVKNIVSWIPSPYSDHFILCIHKN